MHSKSKSYLDMLPVGEDLEKFLRSLPGPVIDLSRSTLSFVPIAQKKQELQNEIEIIIHSIVSKGLHINQIIKQ